MIGSRMSLSQEYNRFFDNLQERQDILPFWKDASLKQRLTILIYKAVINLPIVITFGVASLTYLLFITLYVYPQLDYQKHNKDLFFYQDYHQFEQNYTQVLILLSVLSFSFLMLFTSLIQAIKTSPGYVKDDQNWHLNNLNDQVIQFKESKSDGSLRICQICNCLKPDRAHHCRQCDQCVFKLDHHCPWIGNCVGYYNYKYFFLSVTYGIISCSIFIGSYWETILVAIYDDSMNEIQCLLCISHYTIVIIVLVGLLGLWIFHLYLILKGKTTIEKCEKKDFLPVSYNISTY